MIQLIYISSASAAMDEVEARKLLEKAAAKNARENITGLLYYGGRRFLQVIEGEDARIDRLFDRIASDPRHRGIVTLSRRPIEQREFGEWSMASTSIETMSPEAMLAKVSALVSNAAPSVRAQFESFVALRPQA